jgi:hypothetical protein
MIKLIAIFIKILTFEEATKPTNYEKYNLLFNLFSRLIFKLPRKTGNSKV